MNDLKKFVFSCLILFFGLATTSSAQSLNRFIDQANAFFHTYVQNGTVDYQAIKQHPDTLNQLVIAIGSMPINRISRRRRKAFYINAYNILVIHSIIKHGIPPSPKRIDGFFDQIKHKIGGDKLTLDQIEKDRLLQPYQDPRLHFALVCGAVSCPPLRPYAFTPGQLNMQLTMAARTTLNSNFIRLNRKQKNVKISEIFKWYKSYFLKHHKSLIAFINKYRKQKIPVNYTVTYYKYNWELNSR